MTYIYKKAPLRILIVEDNAYIAARLGAMLNDEVNLQLSGVARNVSGAVLLIRATNPQAVILDIHLEHELTGLNGMDLLKVVRHEYPDIVVMMLSNYSEEQYRQKCMDLGAHYFFDKSNDFDKIPGVLNKIYELI